MKPKRCLAPVRVRIAVAQAAVAVRARVRAAALIDIYRLSLMTRAFVPALFFLSDAFSGNAPFGLPRAPVIPSGYFGKYRVKHRFCRRQQYLRQHSCAPRRDRLRRLGPQIQRSRGRKCPAGGVGRDRSGPEHRTVRATCGRRSAHRVAAPPTGVDT